MATEQQIKYPAGKKIVIVGCGYGGKQLAEDLIKNNANVTIIDTKDSFHHNVAGVRTVVDESYASKMFIPYKPKFGDRFRQGTVTKIDPKTNKITLKDGNTLAYDALVLATGCVGPFKQSAPRREDSIALYSHYAKAVKTSKSVVFIGGGAVGVEAACEVATDFPDKKVTIIHNTDTLIGKDASPEFSKLVKENLKLLGVNVIYGELAKDIDKIQSGVLGSYQITTNKGTVVKADVVFKTVGLTVNKTAYESSLKSSMEPNGALKVNEFLQVDGYKNIFAIGDCNNMKIGKVAFVAGEQGKYLNENLAAFLTGKPMQPWDASRVIFYMGLAMGRNHAVGGMLDGSVTPEEYTVNLKSKDLMVKMFQDGMAQPVQA